MGTIDRPFKLDLENRFLMLLVYYRLYITYILTEFIFDWDQSNVCRDIQKIKSLIRKCIPIPQKTYNIIKRLKTLEEVEKYFPGFMAFTDCTEQQIPRKPVITEDEKVLFAQKEKIYSKDAIDVNNIGIIIHKLGPKEGQIHDYDIHKKNHSVISKDVLNVFDLEYLGVEKDFLNKNHYYYLERRGIWLYL